ncbi:porin family protein [Putridiphycobacter roseus]|nr:porin family protein [Putridiphycobacter roseus]
MRKIITVLTMMALIPCYGQNHFVGLKGGIGTTNINPSFLSDTENRIGFNYGLTYDYQLNKKFNIGVEFLYFQKGFSNEIIFTDALGKPTFSSSIKTNLDYFAMPLKGGFLFGNKITGFVNLGIIPALLLEAKSIIPATEGLTEESTSYDIDYIRKVELGGLIEVGANYKIASNFLLSTACGFHHSITSIIEGSNSRNYGIVLSIGLKYALKRE